LEDNAQEIAKIIEALKNPQVEFVPTSIFTKKMAEIYTLVGKFKLLNTATSESDGLSDAQH
jgi:hypothetical protein